MNKFMCLAIVISTLALLAVVALVVPAALPALTGTLTVAFTVSASVVQIRTAKASKISFAAIKAAEETRRIEGICGGFQAFAVALGRFVGQGIALAGMGDMFPQFSGYVAKAAVSRRKPSRKEGWGRRKAIHLLLAQGICQMVKGRRLSAARVFFKSAATKKTIHRCKFCGMLGMAICEAGECPLSGPPIPPVDQNEYAFSVGALALTATVTCSDLLEAFLGQTPSEMLQGGPAFVLFTALAVVGGIALLSWADREEKKGNRGNTTGPTRLHSGLPLMTAEGTPACTEATTMGQNENTTPVPVTTNEESAMSNYNDPYESVYCVICNDMLADKRKNKDFYRIMPDGSEIECCEPCFNKAHGLMTAEGTPACKEVPTMGQNTETTTANTATEKESVMERVSYWCDEYLFAGVTASGRARLFNLDGTPVKGNPKMDKIIFLDRMTGRGTVVAKEASTMCQPTETTTTAHTQKEGKMSMIEKSNQVLHSVLAELAGSKVTNGVKAKKVKTYGSILAAMHITKTSLTILAGEKIRDMVVKELTKEELQFLNGNFIRNEGDCTVIVRDSQEFWMPNDCMKKLVRGLIIAGHAVGKAVTSQEVNKYFGSLLWAAAETVNFDCDSAVVLSKEVAVFYDATNYISESKAAELGWDGYAIRRFLTANGLIKGMFIVLPDHFFPKGVHVIASEVKPHLMLRNDLGYAIGMQPQSNGHTDEAGTLGLQVWIQLMGPMVAGTRFDQFAKDSYQAAVNGLDKANERLLAVAEEDEDGRDQLLAEASRKHGFNPVGTFRSYAKSLANGLTKAYDPTTVNVAPVKGNGKSLCPTAYPMMLVWMALEDAFKQRGQEVPEFIAANLRLSREVEARLELVADGKVVALVRNLHRLDAATIDGIKQMILLTIMFRIPTGKTSGVEVVLVDAGSDGMGLTAPIVGSGKNDVEFWLFPSEKTNKFKADSEGGDDDDLYQVATGVLADIMRDGLKWRNDQLMTTAEKKAKIAAVKARFLSVAGRLKGDKQFMAGFMDLPFAYKESENKIRVGWPSLFDVKHSVKGWEIKAKAVTEDVIPMTEATRSDVSAQSRLFAEVMVANNDSPFAAAIGSVAQSHKFALGILAGHVVLPAHLQNVAQEWALFIIATILLSDMVDAANKGKNYAQASAALRELNWAWGWLCFQIAKVKDAKVVCPTQFLKTVPPMARDLFEARHAETLVVDGKTRKPARLMGNLFEYHQTLGNAVEALALDEHNRMEFAATVSVMGKDVSVPVGGAVSAEALAATAWLKAWSDSGRKTDYLNGLKEMARMKANGWLRDIRDQQRFMAELSDRTVWAAHAEFDRIVMKALLDATPGASLEQIASEFKVVKLAMVYVNGLKNLHIEDNAVKLVLEKDGKFAASGGVPGFLLPTTGKSNFGGEFTGGSEILIEWMMAEATLDKVAKAKASGGEFKFVVLSLKDKAFGPAEDGKRNCLYTEEDFAGKNIMDILAMPGVNLAGNTKEEAHINQSGWLAAIADDIAKKRTDTLAALKRTNKAAENLLRNKTFAELLCDFRVTSVETCVTGVATVKAIEAFDWRDAKKQAHAQFANTFVIVKFGSESDPDGDKVEAVTADVEVAELPAAAQAEAKKPVLGYSRYAGNFALAGLQYSNAADVAERELVRRAPLSLVRDVAHPKDANAIEVHANGYRFGYVPKETAAKLAPLMDIGTQAWATVTGWENGFVRFDVFLGKTPTTLETFNFQRDKIDDACDRLMWLEAWDATPEQKSRAEATLAHFAALCGSIKL